MGIGKIVLLTDRVATPFVPLVCLISIFCAFSLSVSAATSEKKVEPINIAMTEIGSTMVELYPLVMARRDLSAIEIKKLGTDLEKLEQLFTQIGPYIKQRSTAYQISHKFIKEYLRQTNDDLADRNVDYVRSRLRNLGEICTSCHTQDTELRTLFAGAGREQFADDLTYAEFNYFTRNYPEAEKFYSKYLLSPGQKSELEVVQPIQRLITIYSQILSQPSEGAKKLEKFAAVKGHTNATKRFFNDAIAGLQSLDVPGINEVRTTDFKTLESYVEKFLGSTFSYTPVIYSSPKEEVARVWLRGLLYHYLNERAKDSEIPYILLWLSVCDRAIGYNFYFSLADMYLKECVISYSSHPFARHCFTEYETYVRFYKSDRTTSVLSIEDHREIERLRKFLPVEKRIKP